MHGSAPFLVILKPSRRLAIVLCLAHLAAAAALIISGVPVWAGIAASIALCAQAVYLIGRVALLRRSDSIVAFEARHAEGIPFRTRRGEWLNGRLLATSYVSPRVTILNVRPDRARRVRHVVIASDSIDPDDYRRLRVWLKWGSARESTS